MICFSGIKAAKDLRRVAGWTHLHPFPSLRDAYIRFPISAGLLRSRTRNAKSCQNGIPQCPQMAGKTGYVREAKLAGHGNVAVSSVGTVKYIV